MHGEFSPDARLTASELARRFDTSRTPVREALLLLESEGLVVGARHRGFRVRPLSAGSIGQLYEMRALLESFAARKAAENPARLDGGAAERLGAAIDTLDELRSLNHHGDPDVIGRMMAANSAVHETIVELSGNQQLAALIGRTIDRGVIYRAFDLFSPALLQDANDFHRMIVERIRAGDGARAASLMTEHVYQSRDVVLAAIDAHDGDVSMVFGRLAG